MKKTIVFIYLLFVSSFVISQTQIFHENFELPSLADSVSMDSAGFAVNQWAISTTLASQGFRSDSCTVSVGDTIFLTSNAFSTLGISAVYLDFSHICKIEFFDAAEIYVSNDNGTSWTKLVESQYLGTGSFANIGNKFTSTSYTSDWLPTNNNAIPTNLWWKDERFDISSVAANSAQVKIRFQLTDMNNTGSAGNYGWLIDNIIVWKPAPQEASAEGIHLPLALPSGCGLGNETIEMKIANNGSANINGGLTASFQHDNGPVITETVTNTIIPGDTIVYTFTAKIDLSSTVDTNYQIKVWVTLTNDFYHVNDTVTDSVASRVALPYPAINDTTIPFGTSVLLHATHADSISWFSDPIAQNQIHYGSYYTTPVLFDTTVFYCQADGGSIDSLTTTFASNNGMSGNMFDITAFNALTIDSFYMNGTTSGLVEVWYRPGTYVGYTSSNVGWTKLGDHLVTGNSNNIPVRLPVGGVTILANQTYGFYVTYATGTGIRYTNGNGANEIHQNSDLKFEGRHGGTYFSVTIAPRVWNGRIFYRTASGGASTCPSAVKAVTVNISGPPQYNSGVTELVTPVGAVMQGSTHPVKVAIKNYAGDTLHKVTIGYSVNGVLRTPIVWTGNLLYNDTTQITIGSEYFSGGAYYFKAWTYQPNDSTDGYKNNDTAIAQTYVCLSGSFTLGSPIADFPDFVALQTILTNVGVCGHTVINILPGTYTELLTFTQVLGVTDSSTLTFQSSTGDSTDVAIQYATTTPNQGVVNLSGTDYLRFKKLTLHATGTSYACGVNLTNGATHNIFESCVIKSNLTTSSNGRTVELNTGALNQYNTFKNNVIEGGYYGIYCYGANTTSLAKGNVFEGNEIKDYYYYGAYCYYQDSLIFKGNKVENGAASVSVYGTRFYYCDNIYIVGNKVNIHGTANHYGMYIYCTDTTTADPSLIANNFVSLTGTGTSNWYGTYLYNSTYVNVYYNSYNLIGGSTSSRAFYQTSGNNQNYKNNIFKNSGGGYAAYFNTPAAIVSSDYNDFYTTGSYFVYWSGNKTTLSALQSASGKDLHSVNIDPPLTSTSDLHLTSTLLSGLGTPLTVVTVDIDGTPRSATAPTIGAHEMPLLPFDAGVFNITTPTQNAIVNEGATVPLTVVVKNYGTDTIVSMNIQYSVNNGTPVNQAYTDTLLSNATDIVNLVSFTATAGNSNVCAKTIIAGDTNYFNDEYCQPFFGTPTKDVTVMRIVEIEDDCNIGLDTIQMWIRNVGVDTINGVAPTMITAHYQLDGITTIVNDTVTQQINPGDSALFTFDVLGDFTVTTIDSVFDIAAWIDFVGDNVTYNDSAYDDVKSIHIPFPPQVSDTTIPYGTFVGLSVSSPDSVNWFIDDTTSAVLASGLSYTTPILYDTTTYWVQASGSGGSMEQLNVGTQSSIYTSSTTRGYHFIAPVDMIITELMVPNTVNPGTQYIQVVKFIGSAAIYPALSTFTTLEYIQAAPFGVPQTVYIQINAGDEIGIIGACNTSGTTMSNSYGQTLVSSSIDGIPVTLTRIVLQKSLASGAAVSGMDVSLALNASIGRVEMKYIKNCPSLRVPLRVFVGSIPTGDLEMTSISTPEGCGLDSLTPVTIGIHNLGYDTIIGNFTTSYKIDTNAYVSPENVSDTILPGDTIYYTFNTPADFTATLGDTMFEITAYVNLLGDPNHQNDTLMKDSIESFYTPSPPTVVSPINIQYGTTATLTASSPDSLMWFENLYDTVEVGTGSSFITPILFDTITYWVQAGEDRHGSSGNIALTAIASQSGGGSGLSGPAAYNDGIIPIFGSLPWGWVTTNGWIEYTWSTPQTFNKVKFYKANRPMSACTFQYWDGSTYVNFHNYYNPATEDSVTFPTITTTKLRFNTVAGFNNPNHREIEVYDMSNSGCASSRVPIVVQPTAPPSDDAGISQIVNPVGSAQSGIPHEIKVEIKNFGTATMHSVNIHWTLDGVYQDSVPWTGSLLNDSTEVVILDTMIFNAGVYCIESWTTMPNGVTDSLLLNDSSNACFNACLEGTYTIGDTTGAANFDFPSFNAAKNALLLAGVCGNVTFLVDSGTYYEQLTLLGIPGVSPNAIITFQGASGDSTDVVIQYKATATTNNWVIKLDGIDYIKFKNMTIYAAGSTYGYGVHLTNGAEHNLFESCVIKTNLTTSSNGRPVVLYLGALNQYNTFKNNVIENGYYGIYCYGTSTTSLARGNVFEGNEIINPYYYSTYFYYQDSLQFVGNSIDNANNSGSVYGFCSYYSNNLTVTKNKINIHGTATHYGMYIYYADATPTNRSLIANNFISLTGSGVGIWYGMYLYGSTYIDLYYNSFNLIGVSTTSGRSLYQYGGSNQNFKNNIFTNNAGGYTIYIISPTAILSSDYNNLYTSGSTLAYWSGDKSDLSSLKTASGKDLHSVSINPPFTTASDLHLTSTALSGLGIAVTGITDDIDGNARSQIPTIGADEMPLIPFDAGVSNIIAPITNAIVNEGASMPVSLQVTNFGTDTIFGMNIQYSVNNGTPVSVVYSDTLLSFASDVVTMPNFTAPAGNSNICAKTVLIGDTNLFNNEFCQPFFGTLLNDAGVIDIIQPTTIAANQTTPIEVIVVNYGADTITSVDVSYELNSGSPITQTWTGLLQKGDSVYVLFPATSLAYGQNQICAYTTLSNDTNTINDQKCNNSYVQYVTAAPYVDNFEGQDYWLPDTLANQWERGVPSATNINSAHSPNNVWMIDLDSTYDNNSNDYLYSPEFDFNAVTPDSVIFWHYYNTELHSDGGCLQYYNVNGYWINLGTLNDPYGTNWYNTLNGVPFWSGNSNGWVESKYQISAIIGLANPARFRFMFQSNGSSNNFDGWAIDDFEISIPKMANDPGVTAIITPTDSTQIGSAETVEITIKNFGSDTLLSVPVSYQIDNNTSTNDTWTGVLAPDSLVNYTFTNPYFSPSNNYTLYTWVTGVSPTYTYNDTLSKNVVVTAASLDIGICNIESPISILECKVIVWIKNYGLNTVNSTDVFYHLNGFNKKTQTWTGALIPNDSVQFTFINASPTIGAFDFCAGTDLSGDQNHSNDSLCKPITGGICNDIGYPEIDNGGFILNQNIPNPTNGITQIGYKVPSAGKMRFDLMNILGLCMLSQENTVMAGSHTIQLFVGDLPAGVYYYTAIFEGKRLVKKMVISK